MCISRLFVFVFVCVCLCVCLSVCVFECVRGYVRAYARVCVCAQPDLIYRWPRVRDEDNLSYGVSFISTSLSDKHTRQRISKQCP